ncbi:MAG: hypothetical protein ACR2IT_09770 [Pirellulales bacterium]
MKALPESAVSPRQLRPRQAAAGGVGSVLVVSLLTLALGLATFALWFQWNQTRRCLAFYGADAARSIQSAPRVELWRLQTEASTGRVVALDRTDISAAPGLVHLRRGLVEDANFTWSSEAAPRRSVPTWDVAFAFFQSGEQVSPSAALAVDLDEPGIITVVGRPGRTELGRVGRGLRRWIEATLPEAGSPGEGRRSGL